MAEKVHLEGDVGDVGDILDEVHADLMGIAADVEGAMGNLIPATGGDKFGNHFVNGTGDYGKSGSFKKNTNNAKKGTENIAENAASLANGYRDVQKVSTGTEHGSTEIINSVDAVRKSI